MLVAVLKIPKIVSNEAVQLYKKIKAKGLSFLRQTFFYSPRSNIFQTNKTIKLWTTRPILW